MPQNSTSPGIERIWRRSSATDLDEALATWVDSLCLANLGHRIADARFVNKSVGAVFGVTLADGSHVVLKLFPDIFDETALRAIERALAFAVSVGFPAPRQLAPLTLADGVWGAFYELAPGKVLDAHVSDVRQTLAKLLAEFTSVAVQINPSSLPVTPTRRDVLWGALTASASMSRFLAANGSMPAHERRSA